MVEQALVSTLLPTLPARPPTPPRESDHSTKDTSLFGRMVKRDSSSSLRRSSSTSNHITPESSAESPNTSTASRKKVEWSDLAEYSDPPTLSYDGKGEFQHIVQPLPPSAERKPRKSILKAYNGVHEQDYNSVGSTKLLPPHHHATFATMLQSIVEQLAGKDRSSKMDAYLMLSGSLKASDNVPDVKALKEKMGLLCQFIAKDLNEKLENGKPDSALIINALVLLSSFLQKPVIAETFPADFPPQLVNHAIKCFEDGSMSKDVVKHLMFVLAQQNFSPKVMNQERVGKLITSLHKVEQHMKGKSIVVGRLNIYRTLLRHSRSHMLTNTVWIDDLWTDMLSSIKEVRKEAITFGLESSFNTGTESNASRAVSNFFKQELEVGVKYGDFYANRLKAMIKSKTGDSQDVPRIWSVIILFLRNKPQLLEQWPFTKVFIEVLQRCFNLSDATTRIEANYAWNRFVFAIHPDGKTSSSLVKILCQAPIAQLQLRKGQTLRRSTISSVCNLLYYAFKPTSTPAELDMYWDEYVVPIVGKCLTPTNLRDDIEGGIQDATDACLILECLFDSTRPRQWSQTRAMDDLKQNTMDARELPALDSKWLRKSSSRVFPILAPLLEKMYWELPRDTPIRRLWQAYITSIASPAIKEVKVSIETMGCVAGIFSLLHRVWHAGGPNLESLPWQKGPPGSPAFLASFDSLLLITVQGLGLLPFTEKLLSISQDTFVAIATPSHQPKKSRGEIKSPLHHLVLLLTTTCPGLTYDKHFLMMIRSILTPFFKGRSTSKSQMDLINDLINVLPSESTLPSRMIWQVLADFATIATDTRDEKESSSNGLQPLGLSYRSIVNILEIGISFSPDKPLPGWNTLFEALVNSASIDAGEGGRAIAVIEPLARSFLPTPPKADTAVSGLFYFHLLLAKANYPKDRMTLEAARKRLWGAENTGPKLISYDPYDHLYHYIRMSLEGTYGSFHKNQQLGYSDVLIATTNLLARCPAQLLMATLGNIQQGIACWVQDSERKLSGGTVLSQAITNLWSTVCKYLPSLQDFNSHSNILKALEILICAGLESKHQTIVNATIRLWNSMFGSCEALEYPEHAKAALLRLRVVADIQLPFFPGSLENETPVDQRQHFDFGESQDDSSNFSGFSTLGSAFNRLLTPHLDLVSSPERRIKQFSPKVIIQVGQSSRKRSRDSTPDSGIRKSRKRDLTPRLRHDDSQVQFQPVDSSPTDRVADSQLLTDKQKETRERQQSEAAMFPDLRSSPRAKAKSVEETSTPDPELPIHRSSSKLRQTSPLVERQTTPTLALPSDDDNFVTSSPTPTRSIRGEPEIPGPSSSPPSSPGDDAQDYDENIASSPPETTPEPENNANPQESPAKEVQNYDETIASSPPEATPEPENNVDLPNAPAPEEILACNDGIALSIPEGTLEPGNDTTMSCEPSAQIDPFAMDYNRTLSTFESTAGERSDSPDPSAQLLADESRILHADEDEKGDISDIAEWKDNLSTDVHDDENISGAEENAVQATLLEIEEPKQTHPVQVLMPLLDPQPPTPGTPTRTGGDSPAGQQTPRTPQFVDALSSPASSDKHFEDALSSPRLNITTTRPRPPSSPLSDFDESSVLRMMAGYDQGSGRHGLQVSSPGEKEKEACQTRASSARNSPRAPLSANAPSPALRSALLNSSVAANEVRATTSTDELQNSPLPSLIPETPAPKPQATETSERYFDDDGMEVHMNDTIIVDCSALFHEFDLPAAKRGRKKIVTYSKKRKHVEAVEDSEVPDSQETNAGTEASTSPKKGTPSKKKRKSIGRRSKRLSQVGQSQEDEVERSRSVSVDLDASTQEIDDTTEMSIVQEPTVPAEAELPDTNVDMEVVKYDVAQTHGGGEEEINMTSVIDDVSINPSNEIVEETFIGADESQDNLELDVVEDTTVDETSSVLVSPKAETCEEDIAATSNVHEIITDGPQPVEPAPTSPPTHGIPTSESPILSSKPENDVPSHQAVLELGPEAEHEVEVDFNGVQSMKDKLQGLILDLQTAALSREEVNNFEDMFMDAKEQLFAAGRRGRDL